MKESHPSFLLPEDLNSKVWRYMDFTKFVSLISTSSLYFVRADQFEDKFEGAATKMEKQFREEMTKELGGSEYLHEMQYLVNKGQRMSVGISSWHLSEHESAAMWKLYLKSNEGVAIQTTFKKLADAFDDFTDENIYTGLVRYTDYDTEVIPSGNVFNKFMHKRKSFEFENEVRAIFFRHGKTENGVATIVTKENVEEVYKGIAGTGKYIKIDVNELIDNVIVSPNSDEWFYNLVAETSKKFDFNASIASSKLSEVPYF